MCAFLSLLLEGQKEDHTDLKNGFKAVLWTGTKELILERPREQRSPAEDVCSAAFKKPLCCKDNPRLTGFPWSLYVRLELFVCM